jgi:hypothetical protein
MTVRQHGNHVVLFVSLIDPHERRVPPLSIRSGSEGRIDLGSFHIGLVSFQLNSHAGLGPAKSL